MITRYITGIEADILGARAIEDYFRRLLYASQAEGQERLEQRRDRRFATERRHQTQIYRQAESSLVT